MDEQRSRTSADTKHTAQLLGVAAAYFEHADLAYAHTLKTVLPALDDDENVLAGVPCWRRLRPRTGLLLLTDRSLLWAKQSFFRRHPLIVKLRLRDLKRARYFQESRKRRQLDLFVQGAGDRRPSEWFSFDPDDWDSMDVFCRRFKERVGSRLVVDVESQKSAPQS